MHSQKLEAALEGLASRLSGYGSAVVLDVDRTVVAGTSWHRACKLPGLLIAPALQDRFDALNAAAYGAQPTLPREAFRALTLELISESRPGAGIATLHEAGRLLAPALGVYPSAASFIGVLAECRNRLGAILYLTSGYAPFIRGVLEGLVAAGKLPPHGFHVFGSECEAGPEGLRESLFVSQFDKEAALRLLDARGLPVDFYADDSAENPGIFAFVESRGGFALRIAYEKGRPDSRDWEGFLRAGLPGFLKRQIMERHSSLAALPGAEPPGEAHWVGGRDEIGIPRLSQAEYREALLEARTLLRPGVDGGAFAELLAGMVMARGGEVLLRSRLYYYWLPQSLLEDFDPLPARWERLLRRAGAAFLSVDWRRTFAGMAGRSRALCLLLSTLAEHLLCAVTACLYAAEAEAVVEDLPLGGLEPCHRLAARLAALVAALHGRHPPAESAMEGFRPMAVRRLVRLFRRSLAYHKGLKELDDYDVILRSNRVLIGGMQARGFRYDAVIVFPYGGMDLGYTLLEMLPPGSGGSAGPVLLHCYYSSKKSLRNEWTSLGSDGFDLEEWVPRPSREALRSVCARGGRVLLYDHNATTFGTLARVKGWLEARSCGVDVAAATINYDNLVAALLGRKDAEAMVPGWQSLLDYPATAEYLTAFNTWGTSQKSGFLYGLFRERELAGPSRSPRPQRPAVGAQGREFKVCRVHNICDLLLAWRNGATMIGIHAVHHGARDPGHRPLPPDEIGSIRQMQKHVPEGMKQALIIERRLPVDELERITRAIWADTAGKLVQAQFRVDADWVGAVRRGLGLPVICAIGLFQADFAEYFTFLDALPGGACDHILIDMSKHQPHLIASGEAYDPAACGVPAKIEALLRHAGALARARKRLLIADDIAREDFTSVIRALKGAGVRIAGLDMQNVLELPKQEQVFTKTRFAGEWHHLKQRKSSDRFLGWNEVLAQI